MAATQLKEYAMPDVLLRQGLDCLCAAPTQFPGEWFHGHFGAALLAAHFVSARADLPEAVRTEVSATAQHIAASVPALHTHAFSASGVMGVAPILAALERTMSVLSSDGHGVIYASLALKAFRADPGLATSERVTGIVQLIDNAQLDDPLRYVGYADYKTAEVRCPEVPVFSSPAEAMHFALHDHRVVYPDQTLNHHYYYLAGSKLHTITHAHALLELDATGYGDLALRGLPALRKQLQLCSAVLLPEGLKQMEGMAVLSPWGAPFWQRERKDTHHVKLAYAVMNAVDLLHISDPLSVLRDLSVYWETLP